MINGSNELKKDIELKNGRLEYKEMVTYLGVLISDSGNIMNDVSLYVTEKRSNVIIKFSNFLWGKLLSPPYISN